MIVLIVIMMLALAGNAVAIKFLLWSRDDRRMLGDIVETQRKQLAKKPDTEDVLGYLEAASCTGNETARKLLAAHSTLPTEGTIALKGAEVPQLPDGAYLIKDGRPVLQPAEPPPPKWLHDTAVSMPPEAHWDMFMKDITRETWGLDRVKVLYHWMIQLGNRFTVTEKSLVLDLFDDADDRQMVRECFARAEQIDKGEVFEEPKKAPRKAKAAVGTGGPSAAG